MEAQLQEAEATARLQVHQLKQHKLKLDEKDALVQTLTARLHDPSRPAAKPTIPMARREPIGKSPRDTRVTTLQRPLVPSSPRVPAPVSR